ncbi:MAG: hypothetical protein ACRDK1_04875 [Solirubrobacterales bacterium]
MAIFNRSQQTAPGAGPVPTGEDPPAHAERDNSGSELKRVVDAAAERVDEIVNSAEQVAAEIINGAEAEAARYVEGRRREADEVIDQWSADLQGLAELLSRQENRLRELTEEMIGELGEIAAVLRRVPPEFARRSEPPAEPTQSHSDDRAAADPGDSEPGAVAPVVMPAAPEAVPAPEAAPAPAPERPEPAPQPVRSAGSRPAGREHALLRAAQMAVAGNSREEIERALSVELEIADPAPIVDDLLGARP